MNEVLSQLIVAAGVGQLAILGAAAVVPFRLSWKRELATLPRLHRQMYLTYSGYIVLTITALALICLLCAEEIASGTRLARAFCVFGLLFWGIRLVLQSVFDAKPFLTTWWLRVGYHALTVLFGGLTLIFGFGALHG